MTTVTLTTHDVRHIASGRVYTGVVALGAYTARANLAAKLHGKAKFISFVKDYETIATYDGGVLRVA
ncbi:hypothetical protein ACJ4V0_15710 [Phreatobacter sp. HK31-P]